MTKLIQRMREELVRRNFAESTMRTYLQVVEDFRRYSPTRLDQRGPDDIRRYQVHLLEERKLGVGTVVSHIAALRFFYLKTLKRPAMASSLPAVAGDVDPSQSAGGTIQRLYLSLLIHTEHHRPVRRVHI